MGESEKIVTDIFKKQSWLFDEVEKKKKYVMKKEVDEDRYERQWEIKEQFEEMRTNSVSLLDQILEETKNGPAATDLRNREFNEKQQQKEKKRNQAF